ncbi:S-adenosylmethionine:tRNA ribosyltransferase-isomerase [Marinoscillum sp. MHG1-6]|uniref:S-adenosylmethionine:tRNA ribosyltransferase-isomerase n=1 Tax=Marinoscillum sp. MHG1-6 TaxID=2959627 RepID=UPI00215817ED|nr:S-adenosylmethionine:tRNA ribosyltransferase-isomerase [Marinoscillum sp. MHG1-6]
MIENNIDLAEYTYELPNEKIAKHPLANRSDSKLLHYSKGEVFHQQFRQLPDLLPSSCHLVFNDTKVIPARLIFHKDTGARIEIFLLEPLAPSNIHAEVMATSEGCNWHCMIGNAKKWKIGTELQMSLPEGVEVTALRKDGEEVALNWNSQQSFSEIVEAIGNIPLPPYINREVEAEDKPRYQTVYSHHEGAVAAPTAGLHFTEKVIDQLNEKKITTDYLTLHVSAGTFQPIKSSTVEDHPMHREQVIVTRLNIEGILNNNTIIPVGTTSMRTLESLYWFGVKLKKDPSAEFKIEKLQPYQDEQNISKEESLNNVLDYMDRLNVDRIIGHTEIFIFPGYTFRICKGLVTNFHLPGSTLILLVAALVGANWKKIYSEALNNDYRFLSYGDSSLLMP